VSHEGIKFVAPEVAERTRLQERKLSREAVEPVKVHVRKTEGTCVDDREAAGLNPGETKSEPAQPLQLFKAPPRPTDVKPVGHYAVSFSWNDGHSSGIYSWDYLRRVCQCSECTAHTAAGQ